MITFELLAAISIYYVIMYATPGPNNSILTASGIKFGFTRTIPNIFGIPTGHGIQLALVCLGLGALFTHFPILLNILIIHSSLYIQTFVLLQKYLPLPQLLAWLQWRDLF